MITCVKDKVTKSFEEIAASYPNSICLVAISGCFPVSEGKVVCVFDHVYELEEAVLKHTKERVIYHFVYGEKRSDKAEKEEST